MTVVSVTNSLYRSLGRFKELQESNPFNLNAVTEKSDNQLVFAFWTCLQLERLVFPVRQET